MLAYRRERQIINRAYQQTADNIVGKMTIARLDEDLLKLERQRTPHSTKCGPGGSGIGVASASTLVEQVRALRNHNAQLSIIFPETDAAAKQGGGPALLFTLFAQASKLMAPHGLSFAGGGGGALALLGPGIPDFEQVVTGSPASAFSVRAAAEKVLPGRDHALRVIFAPFTEKDPFFGLTNGGTVGDWTFKKFCLINVRKANPDHGTLLHEMIHAARPERVEHDGERRSVYSENVGGRDQLPAKHAASLAGAYFATRFF